MAKVNDMIGDYTDPRGNSGWSIDPAIVDSVAHEMRGLLEAIYRYNCVADQDVMIAAWEHLNAMERRAWALVVQARGRPCS